MEPNAISSFLSQERFFSLLYLLSGALIAFVSSWLTSYINFKRQTQLNKDTLLEVEARKAQLGFVKLMMLQEIAAGLAHTIKLQIERYSAPEFDDMPMCQKVKGVIDSSETLQTLEMEEVAFLFRSNSPMLFSEIFVIEFKLRALYNHLAEYGRTRDNHIDMFKPFLKDTVDGKEHLSLAHIPESAQLEIRRVSASLDRTIERLRSEAFELKSVSRSMCDQYLIEARRLFGNLFPDVLIEWDPTVDTDIPTEEKNANY